MTDLDIACRCGEVRGTITGASPDKGNHVKCYCRDCQAFAYFCGGEAEALDPAGGSEIYQVRATSVRFAQGTDKLAAVRLTGGPMVRWYTTCCMTPLANTPAPGWLDFAGFQVMTLGPDDAREAAMGPLLGQAFTRFARQTQQEALKDQGLGRFFLRVLGMVASTALTRPARRSPFRDPQSGAFIATPVTLSEEEREKLYVRVDKDRASTASAGSLPMANG